MHILMSTVLSKQITGEVIATPEQANKGRVQVILVTIAALSALKSFREGRFKDFDALVGETSCQLRAAYVQQLALDESFRNKLAQEKVEEKLSRLLTKLQQVFKDSPILMKENECQGDLHKRFIRAGYSNDPMEVQRESFKMSKEALFLILSRTLCVTRDPACRMQTKESQLESFLPQEMKGILDTEFYTEMVLKSKRSLADASVDFISSVAKSQSAFLAAVFKTSIIDSCNLKCAPCFFTIEVILRDVMAKQRAMALVIQRGEQEKFVIPFIAKEGKYHLVEEREAMAEPILFFAGISSHPARSENFVKELLGEEDPFGRACHLIKMNAAAHPQYAGLKKNYSIDFLDKGSEYAEAIQGDLDPLTASIDRINSVMKKKIFSYELDVAQKRCKTVPLAEVVQAQLQMVALKKLAQDQGCTRERTQLFSLQHIYCDMLANLAAGQVVADEEET